MFSQNPVFIPGPTNIPEELRRAISNPSIDHRSETFVEMFLPVIEGVKRILKTKSAEAFIFPSTGTGGWEATITNLLSPGDKILAARHGMFSHRWIDLCQRHGMDVEVIQEKWGKGAPIGAISAALEADKARAIKAVLVTHNETATGVRSDVAGVRQALDATNHPALLFVDGVSSIASMDFRMDDWGVDAAVTGSQKGFMLPPGLAILGISQKAMQTATGSKSYRCFFDFKDMQKANASGGFPYTPPANLIRGLETAIEMLETEGLENVFLRHRRIAEGVRRAASAWKMKLCAAEPSLYSDTVSAICTPDGFNATEIVTHAANKYSIAFGVGLGDVAGKVFRIGHLGSMTDVMALSGIAAAEMTMADLGLDIRLGSGVAAAQEYYRGHQAKSQKAA
jgi:alanine-glyoxylate transaminase/serine-glyoxylate transaminase/serine-pyruvate transaminase